MLDKLLGELVGVDRIGPRLLEGGMSVLDAETVLDDRLDRSVGGDVRETHLLAVPVQLSAGIARTMCPIAGVIIAVSGIAGLSPFELVRRTAPVMILALIMNVAASAIFL